MRRVSRSIGPSGLRRAHQAAAWQPHVAEYQPDEVARRLLGCGGLKGRDQADQPNEPGQEVNVQGVQQACQLQVTGWSALCADAYCRCARSATYSSKASSRQGHHTKQGASASVLSLAGPKCPPSRVACSPCSTCQCV